MSDSADPTLQLTGGGSVGYGQYVDGVNVTNEHQILPIEDATGTDALVDYSGNLLLSGSSVNVFAKVGELHLDAASNVPSAGAGDDYNSGSANINAGYVDVLTTTKNVSVLIDPVFHGSVAGDASFYGVFYFNDTTTMQGLVSYIYSTGQPTPPTPTTLALTAGHTYTVYETLSLDADSSYGMGDQTSGAADFSNTASVVIQEVNGSGQAIAGNPDLSFASGYDYGAACFAAGTRIDTPEGERAVDRLQVGDLVCLADGLSAPVIWLGHRHVDVTRHPDPARVAPLRVKAGAFGNGAPRHDLILSPDHAVLAAGVLVPVRHLENGATIVREPVRSVTYWHVELAVHAVILAQGLAVESYLDTGDRHSFANSGTVVAFAPEFGAWRREMSCLPLVVDGPEVDRARALLARPARRRSALPDAA